MGKMMVQMKGSVFSYGITQTDSTCQKCGAPIHWVETHRGKQMPVDIPDPGTTLTTCHYDTCVRR